VTVYIIDEVVLDIFYPTVLFDTIYERVSIIVSVGVLILY